MILNFHFNMMAIQSPYGSSLKKHSEFQLSYDWKPRCLQRKPNVNGKDFKESSHPAIPMKACDPGFMVNGTSIGLS